jgi:hypothetical protein
MGERLPEPGVSTVGEGYRGGGKMTIMGAGVLR